MARDLRVSAQTIGYVATALQVGYALGIVTFVPFGDIVERRTMVVGMFAAASVALVFVAIAPTVALLALAVCIVGLVTTAAQVLIPFAADLATPAERGRVVGTIQGGLIVGTLMARALGGLIGAHFGWRAVYVFAAVVAALSTIALARVMPRQAPTVTLRYRELMASIPPLVARYAPLRVSMLLGFISFAVFAGIWTVMAFQLHTLGYEADVVGYVGLVSVAGALSAGWFGGLADLRGTLFSGTIGWLVTLLALGVYFAAGQSLVGVVVASLFFSVGTQTTQISNQTRNFALSDDARSRINTIYMASNFIGGATGAFVAATLWERGGWPAVCEGLLAATACMGLVLAVYARSRMKYR